MRKPKLKWIAAGLLVLAVGGYVGFHWWRTKNVSAVQRGYRVAESKGCFTCHGPAGTRGMPNPGYGFDDVPNWVGEMTMYAQSEEEIREWILDGVTPRFKSSRMARFFLERQPIKMPAYRGHITEEQVDRIIDYIHWLREHPY